MTGFAIPPDGEGVAGVPAAASHPAHGGKWGHWCRLCHREWSPTEFADHVCLARRCTCCGKRDLIRSSTDAWSCVFCDLPQYGPTRGKR